MGIVRTIAFALSGALLGGGALAQSTSLGLQLTCPANTQLGQKICAEKSLRDGERIFLSVYDAVLAHPMSPAQISEVKAAARSWLDRRTGCLSRQDATSCLSNGNRRAMALMQQISGVSKPHTSQVHECTTPDGKGAFNVTMDFYRGHWNGIRASYKGLVEHAVEDGSRYNFPSGNYIERRWRVPQMSVDGQVFDCKRPR